MNHGIYRLVFNVERNAWVAVAEFVRGRGKKSARKRVAAVMLGAVVAGSALAATPIPPSLSALPVPSSGSRPFVFHGAVSGGAPTTAMVNGINTMTVPTASRTVGLNWDSFNVGGQAAVEYTGEALRILNRIWSNDPSQIMGRLSAPGKELYFINQNGILFGNGAQVNVGGLVASSLNMTDAMASKLLNNGLPTSRGDSLEFSWEGSASGFEAGFVTVDAGARITTPTGGKVVLIAPKTVENLGIIESGGGGEAILAAGGKVILTAPDDPNLRGLLVETQSVAGRDALGNTVALDGSVTNNQVVDSDGVVQRGRIDMGKDGVVTLAALAVNQKGIINATRAVNLNGTTMLVSGSGTTDTERLTINQRGAVAEIDWASGFNVGAGTKVEFVQPTAGATAYNIIYDPNWKLPDDSLFVSTAGRSNIDGAIVANGQLVFVNEKGFNFGASARVSANSFVASGLGMNRSLLSTGLLGQTDVTKRAFYLYESPTVTFKEGEDTAQKFAEALSAFREASVTVAAGAQIESLENGYVILAGSQVNQGGTILAGRTTQTDSSGNPVYKGGQVVLAAGADLYLKPGFSSAYRGFSAEVNPLVALRTHKYQRNADGSLKLNSSGNPTLVSEGTPTWLALSRGELNANRVINSGTVRAALGDITLVGNEIIQAGTLWSSTSAVANGSIHLNARDMLNTSGSGVPTVLNTFYRQYDEQGIVASTGTSLTSSTSDVTTFIAGREGGTLSFADGSSTVVAIDGSDGRTLTGDQTFVQSSIEALAKKIVIGDADIEAKAGRIQFRASDTFSEFNAFGVDGVSVPQDAAASGVGIYVADGARIDASGTSASKAVSDLFIRVELRGDELADNTVQRNGALRGEVAWVDVRDSVSIANIDGWINAIGQTVDELASTGGTISLGSLGSVVVKSGAELDVSGGRIDYSAGTVNESMAITFGGQRYRLNDAPTSAAYAGLVTQTRQEAAYVEGKSAGTVEVVGHNLAVDGNLVAKTTIGTRQRTVGGDPKSDRYALPLGGQLIIKDAGQHYTVADRQTASKAEKDDAYLRAQIAFVKGAANAAAGLGTDDVAGPRLELSENLVDNGFSRFSITSDGRIDIPAEVGLNLREGGNFSAAGRQIYVAGDISTPGGSISLTTRDMSQAVGNFPVEVDGKYSTLVLASGAKLSTAGRWVNDFLDGKASTTAKAINGGSISLSSAYDLDLVAGSQIDVSGGGWVNAAGTVKSGDAGSIALESGSGFQIDGDSSRIFLDGTLSGYALGKGGSLKMTTASVEFASTNNFDPQSRNWSHASRMAEGQVGISLDEGVVDKGGFYSFAFVGRDALTVGKKITLSPDPLNWSLAEVASARYQATGSAISGFADTRVLHSDRRSGPTKLSLTTTNLLFGDLLVNEEAYLGVSPKGSINLESAGQLTVLGTLEAPAGTITLSRAAINTALKGNYTSDKQSESIYLGPKAKLLAAGTAVLSAATRQALEAGVSAEQLLRQRRYVGELASGGTVSLDAGLGYVVTREGSLIDVSGETGTLNIAANAGTGVSTAAQTVGSSGGTVKLAAHAGMFLDGGFDAAGGKDALGGVFSLSLAAVKNDTNPWGLPEAATDDESKAIRAARLLTLYQSADKHAAQWPSGVDTADYLAGEVSLDAVKYNGKAALDLASLLAGGFGSWYLTSQNEIQLSGLVDATVQNQLVLNAPRFSAATDTTDATLRAAAIQIGNSNPVAAISADDKSLAIESVSSGNGQVSFHALDIGLLGAFGWSGFGESKFISSGAIHFDSTKNEGTNRSGGREYNGLMRASGDLVFSAARLSPSTYSDFKVDVLSDPNGSIAITRPDGAYADVSLSPAGRLEFAAATITHDGTVTAPLGEIVFSAPGGSVTLGSTSKTSVAADRDLLFGYTLESGGTWNYNGVEVTSLPAKSVVVDGAHTTITTGAEIDLSGGGEALAWEFTAGPGGKNDVLAGSVGTYAIVPNWNGFSATDSELQNGYLIDGAGGIPSVKAGDQIELGKNPYGLSGSYVLLPARYAVLPGAYLVTVKASNNATLGGALQQADGTWLVSGQRLAVNQDGSTTAYGNQPLTLELASSAKVAERAKYVLTTATEFFYDKSDNLAGDAGRLAAIGRESLVFDPAVIAMRQAEISAENGRKRAGQGMQLDLAAPKLMVSDSASAPDDTWSLIDQEKLNALGVSSLLLGGVRTVSDGKTHIDTLANSLRVSNTASALAANEIMLTANQDVTITAKSKVESIGEAVARSVVLSGDGAFMRVAESGQAVVTRDGTVAKTAGDLFVEATASVAGRALYFDATHKNVLSGEILLGNRTADGGRDGHGAVAIGAGRINVVGDNSVPTEGLTLSNSDLARFALAEEIRLSSYTTLDFYGNAELGTESLNRLVLASAGLAGRGAADTTASIKADTVVLENIDPANVKFAVPAGQSLGKGKLDIAARTVEFGGNATSTDADGTASMRKSETAGFTLGGFDAVSVKASKELRFSGTGVTKAENSADSGSDVALNIDAGRVVTVGTADHLLLSTGKTTVTGGSGATGDAGLGGSLELRGKAIDVAGRIETPAGKLTLRATGSQADGGVLVRDGAVLAAEGRKVAFDDTFAYAPGGSIVLKADAGDVSVKEGARVSVAANPDGGEAGSLTLEAVAGTVFVGKETLLASAKAGAAQGKLKVDATSLKGDTAETAADNLDALVEATLQGSLRQFGGVWDIRQRVGDLALSKSLVAADVLLATDQGGISIAKNASIDASGPKGGRIALYSRNGDVTLGGNLLAMGQEFIADANNAGTRGEGGTVILSASGSGKVITDKDSLINVAAATRKVVKADGSEVTEYSTAKGGKVTLRGEVNLKNADWLTMLPISHAGKISGASDVAAEFYYTETGTSLANGDSSGSRIGLESINSKLASSFTDENLEILRKSLGFTNAAVEHIRPGVEIVTPDDSTGDFTISANLAFNTLRFGAEQEAGALTIRAAGDLKVNGTLSDGFVPQDSNVSDMTVRDAIPVQSGQSWSFNLVAGADRQAANPMTIQALPVDASDVSGSLIVKSNAIIRTGTGDIALAARRNIVLNKGSAIYTAGLSAAADALSNFTPYNGDGTFAPVFLLGGGDIQLLAGERISMESTANRHINQWLYRLGNDTVDTQWWARIGAFQEGVAAFGGGDISVSAGTEIKNLTVVIPTNGRVPSLNGGSLPESAVVQGGGDLSVYTPGTITGGLYYVETGTLNIEAGSLSSNVGLAMGDTEAKVVATGNIELGNVFNPLWVQAQPKKTNGTTNENSFYKSNSVRIGTYGDDTALDVVSIAGDVALNAESSFYGIDDAEAGMLMPSQVKVVSLNGSIDAKNLSQAPGTQGQLDLLASGSITLDNPIIQLDLPSYLLPSLSNPIRNGGANGRSSFWLSSYATEGSAREKHSESLWHADDYEASRLIALNGDIVGNKNLGSESRFNEAVHIKAGGDLKNVQVDVQHAHASDVSTLEAGGSILFEATSTVAGLVKSPAVGIRVGGPGSVELIAGESVDLADTQGVVTRGNLDNPYLAEEGSSILVAAGGKPDYEALRAYLGAGAEVDEAALRDQFFVALREIGREAEKSGNKTLYDKARALADAFFSGDKTGNNDIRLSVSQIKTEQGGDIHLLAPDGSIVVGVADPTKTKTPSSQGIFTVNGGDIFAFVERNFLVNQSRVFSLNGGDIMIFSNYGDIDAGSGSKTAASTPPPVLVVRNGQIVLDTSNSISGSGIGVLASRDDTPASDMDLFAPEGAIDAGDAGLRSTGNITLGARTILNASNIQAAGTVTGAPAPVTAAAPVAAVTTPTNNENKALEDAAPSAGKRDGAGGMLTVEVLDSEPASDSATIDEEERKRKARARAAG